MFPHDGRPDPDLFLLQMERCVPDGESDAMENSFVQVDRQHVIVHTAIVTVSTVSTTTMRPVAATRHITHVTTS